MVAYRQDNNNSTKEKILSIEEIYQIFLTKVKPISTCLYEKLTCSSIEQKKPNYKHTRNNAQVNLVKRSWMKPFKQFEGDVLKLAANMCLLNFVAWKDNIVHKNEVRLIKLAYTLVKKNFPQENHYHEIEMNHHLSQFMAFLMFDFEFEFIPDVLNHLYENHLSIPREEMKLQLEMVSKIDGYKDSREKNIINDVISCFYDKSITLEEFMLKLKTGTDFQALRVSASEFPELRQFLI